MNLIILSRNAGLYSTNALKVAARNRGHSVLIMDHLRCELTVEQNKPAIHYLGQEVRGMDAILPRIGASATDFGARVIRQFEMMGVYTSLNSTSLFRSRDKFRSLQLLATNGVPIPKTAMIHYGEDPTDMLERMEGDKFIVKLLSSTHGAGVILTESRMNTLSTIEALQRLKKKILLQEFVAESDGCDLRVFVVNGEVVASMERMAQEGEFRSNFHLGGRTRKVQLTKDENAIALKSARILGLEVAGVDILRSHEGPKVIEVNASPGLEGIQRTTGVDIATKIIQFIERKMRKKSKVY